VQVDRQGPVTFFIRHWRQHDAIHRIANDIRRLDMRAFIARP